jgi:predicted membrane protein
MELESRSNRRFLFGVVLIVFGSLWILERLNILPHSISDMIISWQSLLIVIGIVSLINGNATTGWVLVLIGGLFMVPHVFEIPWELRRLAWPVILVTIGVLILVRYGKPRKGIPEGGPKNMNYFDDFVIFGGREMVINSQSLVGGKTTSIFGGSEYDLRPANLSENGAVIDCVSMFGGAGFKIPPDWTIKNEITTIFGAFTDKRGSTVPDMNNLSKTLILRGFTAFGGVEIKNF